MESKNRLKDINSIKKIIHFLTTSDLKNSIVIGNIELCETMKFEGDSEKNLYAHFYKQDVANKIPRQKGFKPYRLIDWYKARLEKLNNVENGK